MVRRELIDNDKFPLMNRKCPYCDFNEDECSCSSDEKRDRGE